ncbi:hypothetical protein [Nonomuraea sp. SYSU D8015]|uniref:hypothetical protein n=1 Tax=Nonomuraea sp. SYSU D8015 TaxID=2593644 RepID=UPI0016614172|nr:hypothetical protein [Nonomuraea sp. SYSU D8015]
MSEQAGEGPSTRRRLVVAAVRHATGSIAEQPPDTGELRGDVVAVLRRMARRFRDLGPDAVHGLMPPHPRVVSLPVDLLRHELLLTRQPVSDETISEIVDEVFLPLVRRPAGRA